MRRKASLFGAVILFILCSVPAGRAHAVLRQDLSAVIAYPNPFEPRLGHAAVLFDNLTAAVRIRIYTLAGELVYDTEGATSDGVMTWSVKNNEGTPLAYGTYIYLVTNESGHKKTGKIAVLK